MNADVQGVKDLFDNPLGTDGFEFVEFTAPEPERLSDLFQKMGFSAVARHRSKNVLRFAQGDINFILNMEPQGQPAAFREEHGPSANAMAFRVKDAAKALKLAVERGATPVKGLVGPMELNIPAIEGIGGSNLYLVDRYGAQAIYDVDFTPLPGAREQPPGHGLTYIDHLTHNVRRGQMGRWADFYERIFNFREIRYFDIEGAQTGLISKAMTSPCGKIRIPLNESRDDHSQIEEFLRDYRGEGIQHIALGTDDIFHAVETMAALGVKFQDAPDTYYDRLDARLPGHGQNVQRLRADRILVDGAPTEGQGLLLQIFTQNMIGPIFFELIQREGNEGFGEGNFRALFESIEADQVRRGVLPAQAGLGRTGAMSGRNWIPVRGAQGRHSRQAHADMPEGTYEREVSKEGFFGPAAFFHHPRPPTGWSDFEGPLRPRAFDLTALNEAPASPWGAPRVLSNAHVELRFWKLGGPMGALARNADGDQLLFVHQGRGDLFCDYGRLAFRPGDYLYLPRGTLWRLAPDGPAALLMIEATGGHYTLPDRGLLGPHALFDPAILETPAMDEAFRDHQATPGAVRVEVKKRGAVSTVTYPYNPLDAVGWHGDLAPVRLNVADLRPVTSHRYHLPPSVHTTFLGERFVVCTFAPRPFETDPGALKVPFFHNNDDYDEVLFYHAGDFFSRDHIAAGALTFHPSGFTHGPHPKALKAMLVQSRPATDEYAVMIDARDPLDVADEARAVENLAYVESWKTPGP